MVTLCSRPPFHPEPQRRLGHIQIAGDTPNRLSLIEHQSHRSCLKLIVKLPAWSPGLRRLRRRGRRIRLPESVYETGSSPALYRLRTADGAVPCVVVPGPAYAELQPHILFPPPGWSPHLLTLR